MQTEAHPDSFSWKEEFREGLEKLFFLAAIALRGTYSKLSQPRIQISNLISCPGIWAHENRLPFLSYRGPTRRLALIRSSDTYTFFFVEK